jgi:hypothetical protein
VTVAVQDEVGETGQSCEKSSAERELSCERQRDELGQLLGERLDRRR